MAPHANDDFVNGSKNTTFAELPVFSITKLTDERTKTLAECLRGNHDMFAVLRDPYLIFHNHMPHNLGSAYYLGANSDRLREIAKSEGDSLRPHDQIPEQEAISKDNWREHLTQKDHTLAYQKFFDNEIEAAGGDWKKVVNEYLYSGDAPLVNGFCGGLAHPFIHLAYAYEYDSKEVASEALSMASTEYDMMHGYIDNYPPDTSTYKTADFEEILRRVREDKRFDGQFDDPGFMNTFKIHQTCQDVLLEHWNALDLTDGIEKRFEELFDVSVRLAIETGDKDSQFDFFLIHILTVAHAIRFLLPTCFPRSRWSDVYRQYWLWTLQMYVAQLRRPIDAGSSNKVELEGRDWKWVQERALTDKWSLDSHYIKVIRALKVGEELYGEKNGWYLKAGVKFIDEFGGWVGFGRGVEDYPH